MGKLSDKCSNCGSTKSPDFWDYPDGTVLCDKCEKKISAKWEKEHSTLAKPEEVVFLSPMAADQNFKNYLKEFYILDEEITTIFLKTQAWNQQQLTVNRVVNSDRGDFNVLCSQGKKLVADIINLLKKTKKVSSIDWKSEYTERYAIFLLFFEASKAKNEYFLEMIRLRSENKTEYFNDKEKNALSKRLFEAEKLFVKAREKILAFNKKYNPVRDMVLSMLSDEIVTDLNSIEVIKEFTAKVDSQSNKRAV